MVSVKDMANAYVARLKMEIDGKRAEIDGLIAHMNECLEEIKGEPLETTTKTVPVPNPFTMQKSGE